MISSSLILTPALSWLQPLQWIMTSPPHHQSWAHLCWSPLSSPCPTLSRTSSLQNNWVTFSCCSNSFPVFLFSPRSQYHCLIMLIMIISRWWQCPAVQSSGQRPLWWPTLWRYCSAPDPVWPPWSLPWSPLSPSSSPWSPLYHCLQLEQVSRPGSSALQSHWPLTSLTHWQVTIITIFWNNSWIIKLWNNSSKNIWLLMMIVRVQRVTASSSARVPSPPRWWAPGWCPLWSPASWLRLSPCLLSWDRLKIKIPFFILKVKQPFTLMTLYLCFRLYFIHWTVS